MDNSSKILMSHIDDETRKAEYFNDFLLFRSVIHIRVRL